MYLKSISLQNFRNYKKTEFDFSREITLIVGPNTAGKSNLIEALFFLAKGSSFRIDKDIQLVKFKKEIARIKGKIEDSSRTFFPSDKILSNNVIKLNKDWNNL